VKSSGLIILSFLFLFVSCKKKREIETQKYAEVLGNESGTIILNYRINDSTVGGKRFKNDSTIEAEFFAKPGVTGSVVPAGAVCINTVELEMSQWSFSKSNIYRKTNGINLHHMNWSIGGEGIIPAFSFSCAPEIPSFNGLELIPDTLSKSNFSFVVGAASYTNENTYIQAYQKQKLVNLQAAFPSTISLAANDQSFSNFSTGAFLHIQLAAYAESEVTIDGRFYPIHINYLFDKLVYLKP
jgi:hypothetical protein